MPNVDADYWFLPSSETPCSPAYTRGNAVQSFIDGMGYMADLHREMNACDGPILIAGWRMSNEQKLNPHFVDGQLQGQSVIEAVTAAVKRGCSVKALLFNVPGTEMPGPFRFWHARDNYEFADALDRAGGECILDSRLPPVAASAHHQKFVILAPSRSDRHIAYVGGIDMCLDRWDRSLHDAAPERQRDVVRAVAIETHTPSQPGWHDVQVGIRGPAIEQIWKAFQRRWNDPRPANHRPLLSRFRRGTPLEDAPAGYAACGTQAVQVTQTLPPDVLEGTHGDTTVARALERAIERAEHFIYVEDQYAWPCTLVDKLEQALTRGVRVLIVVARDYDAPGLAPIAKRLRHQVVARLRKAGGDNFQICHIEREDGRHVYVHSKVVIVDDCYASVGSANFNARSLTNDSELQVGIVDEELVQTTFDGNPATVCRFAHDLRCALWAEHLELPVDAIRDPVFALTRLWTSVPIAPSRRAHKHNADLGPFNLDPVAEYLTTLLTERMAHLPILSLPFGISERSTVKLAVDTALRGPHGALLLKSVEELLNPDMAPSLAGMAQAMIAKVTGRAEADPQGSLGDQIVAKLRRKELPQMVDWFDPGLLAQIGMRDAISGTIGQYADQRLMQAASDHVTSEQDLASRYDYSDPHSPVASRRLATDEQGRVWIDYVADLGDGFEATYAVASLLAKERLTVAGATKSEPPVELPAGRLLVMGGDQAYPQATLQEYQKRLVDPYTWAYLTDKPDRKLFAIPGNHDWYDGLNAFTSLFTSARDRISGGLGRQIGVWRCQQHRSYWAIKLPYDWWIWGPDIQLAGTLDDPQRDYFDLISDFTRPGDKIIICLAEPSWHHENYDNLHEISMLARKRGAKICAVLAGDWHHYSRYTNNELGVQFITCGGGGAFAHATHHLKNRLDLHWAEVTGLDHRKTDPADPLSFNRMEQGIIKEQDGVDFTLKDYDLGADGVTGSPRRASSGPRSRVAEVANMVRYSYHTPRIYPSKARSRLLALRNLFLPFHNVRFAAFVGFIYLLYAWVFQVSAPPLDPKTFVPAGKLSNAESLAFAMNAFWSVISPSRVMTAVKASPMFFFMLLGLWIGLISYVESGKGLLGRLTALILGSIHFFGHLAALLVVNLVAFLPATLLAGAGIALITHALPFLASSPDVLSDAVFLSTYAGVAILMGGLVGAFIMGLYWTLTSTLLNMHCGDAFGALGIRNYKSFLRMSIEPDRVTIFPIGVDKVPGRRGWRSATATEMAETPSQIVPKTPLRPFLIETPVVVEASKIRS